MHLQQRVERADLCRMVLLWAELRDAQHDALAALERQACHLSRVT
jgi:hypothetical protein